MEETQRSVASFLIRFTQDLWKDDDGEPQVQWRGFVRHVQGEEETAFTNFAKAVAFVQGQLTRMTLDALARAQPMNHEKALQKSFAVWEQFATTYVEVMLEAMGRAARQSQMFREQVDDAARQAMSQWQPSAEASPEDVLHALRALQEQVQSLCERVERLEKDRGRPGRP